MEENVKSIEKKEEVLQSTKQRKPIAQEALIIDAMLYSVVYIKLNGDYSSLMVEGCSLTQTQDMQLSGILARRGRRDNVEWYEEETAF